MFLTKITLLQFKNHESVSLQFSKKLNCFIGKNGVGKTNLLDAIYYLCLTKSYFNSVDQQNILFGKDFFRIEGRFQKTADAFEVVYKLPPNKRKELTVNDVTIPKLSDHIGNFPCIIISPDDSQLVTGGSEERRKFIDGTISQVNHEYLEWLIAYNKVLTQRNAALRSFAETKRPDRTLLETYNRQLIPLGTKIYEARKVVLEKLKPLFQQYYKQISLEREPVSFSYYSQLNEKTFDDLLHVGVEKDLMLQRTDSGIHKDDIDFYLGTNKMKKFGSQGQQKSFIIALKLAQYEFVSNARLQPVLLIDDIFDKLDNDRSRQLINLIVSDKFGQVFITDTDDAHIREVLADKADMFEVIEI